MKPLRHAVVLTLALAACTSGRASAPVTPAPVPATPAAPATHTTTAAPAAAARTPAEAPEDWHLLDLQADGVPGISLRRAERELLAGREPRRTVVVAVIDGGVDTAHADLRANLWRNPKEVAGNGKDDDGNGYSDDVYGWNFIGGPDGRNVHHDTHEVTRLHAGCLRRAAAVRNLPAAEQKRCDAIAKDYQKKRTEAEQTLMQVQMFDAAYSRILPLLKQATGSDSLTKENVSRVSSPDPQVRQARGFWLQLADAGLTPRAIDEAREAYEGMLKYGLDTAFNPRPIVRDDTLNLAQRRYGNRDVMGPDAGHGTHVAGIIGAVRGNGEGVDGVAPSVRIMAIRAVPDGDERDKDIASAIRYAADNGAQIINMSFGKRWSPQKPAVDDAVRYAESKGVLMVHASGNDGENLAENENYPSPAYAGGGRAQLWIEVGASSWKGKDSLAASFSNYGREQVDVFAPGVDILSAKSTGGYVRQQGTSMAAPVVSGLAALLMAHFPELTAADVKRIILESATKHGDQRVVRPGTEDEIPFGQLSATGGVVNAWAAVKMAQEAVGKATP